MWGVCSAPREPRVWGTLLMTILFRRHTLSVAARLTMLALSTALPLVALAGFVILRAVDDQRAQIQRDVRERVENLLTDVDRQISAIQAELQVLAVSPSLQDDDLRDFDRQMRAALKIRGTAIVLLDTKAQQLINTNRPFGEPLPRAINTEMLDRAVETGKPQISDLIIGAVLRRPVLTVGVPVFRDDEVAYVLLMVLGRRFCRLCCRNKICRPTGPPRYSIGKASLSRVIGNSNALLVNRLHRHFGRG